MATRGGPRGKAGRRPPRRARCSVRTSSGPAPSHLESASLPLSPAVRVAVRGHSIVPQGHDGGVSAPCGSGVSAPGNGCEALCHVRSRLQTARRMSRITVLDVATSTASPHAREPQRDARSAEPRLSLSHLWKPQINWTLGARQRLVEDRRARILSDMVGLNGFAVGSGAGVSVRVPGQRSRLCNPDGERP